MGEVIVITSGKGGVGKTTSAANIGAALSLCGKRVVIVDMDLGLRKLDISLGIGDRVAYDIVDVLQKRCTVRQALLHDKRFYECYILPASQTCDKSAINEQQMKELCEQLKQDFDYVLIDCPAGIEQGFVNAVCAADKALIVVIPEPASIRDADRVLDLLADYGIQESKVLINRFREDMARRGDMLSVEEIIHLLRVGIVGVIPEEDDVLIAIQKGKPVLSVPDSRAAICYQNVAKRLLGETPPLEQFRPNGFWKRLKKAFQN